MILHQSAELRGGLWGKAEDHDTARGGIQAMDEACGGMILLESCQEILLTRWIGLGGDARRLADKEEIAVLIENLYVHFCLPSVFSIIPYNPCFVNL
jgi:hypothetical protein